MLNVSCQKQKHCSSLPADSLTGSPMECLGQPRLSGACNVSEVPGFCFLDVDDDEGEVVIGIRPKSSPLPRRKSSVTDEDSEPELPLCGSRRVSFADAKGLSLVQVKEFDTWDVPKLPGYDTSEGDGKDAEEYFLSPLTFSLPLSTEELLVKVQEQKVELETIALIPGTTILKGVIRVFNISYSKAVYIRTTLDTWSSHFDLLAEYIPGSSDSLTDCFSFKLTLVPPFGEQGARVEFCLRYETSVGTFWSNNNNRNYVLFCHQRAKEKTEKPHRENVSKKSCLRMVSQNFSTVENISAIEASSQENISTDVSKHKEEVEAMKAKQICNGQSGTSEENQQKLLIESRQNSSRRSRRKAARMARVRDYFAQRDGGANDTERDESPPEAKQVAQEEIPKKQNSEGSSKSEGAQFVPESVEICGEPLLDVLHDASAAHDCTSKSEPEKSERINLADSLTGSESATDIPDNPLCLNDEPAPAECQNINKSVSKAEKSSQEQGMSHDCNIVAEPADSVFSAVSIESLVIQPNSLTFGTVMAPLYHQVFGRVGSESQSVGDWRNPIQATLNVGDLTQSFPPTERKETSFIVPTEDKGNTDKVQGKLIKSQESNQECFDATLNSPPFVTTNDHAETLQDPVEIIHPDQSCPKTSEVLKTISGDTEVHQHTVNIINTDLLNPQIPSESLLLQGAVQEDNMTPDHHSQTAAETARAQLPEHTCAQIKTNLDETLTQCGTQEAMTTLKTSIMSLQLSQTITDETDRQASSSRAKHCECVDESNKHDVVGQTVIISTKNAISEEAKLLEALHDLNNHSNNLATEETNNCYISCFESVKEKDFTAPQISLETQEETGNVEEGNKVMSNLHKDERKHSAEIKVIGEVADSLTKAAMSNDHIHGEMVMRLKDVDILKDEVIMVSKNIEYHGIKTAVSKQEDFSSADTAEVKNWEMMVEEEEKNILTDEEKSNTISLKAEDIEAVEEDQGEQLEDAGIETASENRAVADEEKEKTEDKREVGEGEITAAREKESKAEDADVLGDKQRIGQEEIGETVVGKDGEEGGKELEYTQATKTKMTAGVEEPAEEEQEETVIKEEKHRTHSIQEEQPIGREEEMETDLYTDNEAGVDWEYKVKPKEENVEEEIPGYKEEIPVEEMGQSEIVDAGSESMTTEDRENEVACSEERLDISQNKVEYSLPALVNNVHDKRVFDKENTGEGQNAHMTTERHLHKEEDFQTNKHGTHDLSKPVGDENHSTAADGDLCIFADEPEGDQASHDSGSADSDSDDEVELYMHCLRAVHTGAQTHKDRNKDTGFIAGKRPSVSRSKLLSTPMPSISESLDEDQHLSRLQDNHEDTETADVLPTAATLPVSSGQESIKRNVSWWLQTFSFSNIAKTLLYATLLVVFVVVAYHYDFLACFGLYLISVVLLCRQGERQPVKDNRLG
ncbi:titin homolog [Pempheris klunzingeri]|uniref:titin homolog n=1 Tax=Pempheris klunzingeri TaxID=3127111 RepID=UPI0039801B0C